MSDLSYLTAPLTPSWVDNSLTYSNWSSTDGAGISDPFQSHRSFANYQRKYYFQHDQLNHKTEEGINRGLATALISKGLATEIDLQDPDKFYQLMGPQAPTQEQEVSLVTQAFGQEVGSAHSQDLSTFAGREAMTEAERATMKATRDRFNKAKKTLVDRGELPFAALEEDEGRRVIGGRTDTEMNALANLDLAVKMGAASYNDAYAVSKGTKQNKAIKRTFFEQDQYLRLYTEIEKNLHEQ